MGYYFKTRRELFLSVFFFHFTPSVLCSHHHGDFEGRGGSVSWLPQMHKIFVKLYGFVESKVGFVFF